MRFFDSEYQKLTLTSLFQKDKLLEGPEMAQWIKEIGGKQIWNVDGSRNLGSKN